MASQDEDLNFTVVPEVDSLNRGSGLPLVYASGLLSPTSAGREFAANDANRSTMCRFADTICANTF